MPNIKQRAVANLKARYESAKAKGSKTELKNKLEALKTRAQTNIAKDKRTALPESHRFVSAATSRLSQRAAKQVPLTVSRQIEYNMESLPFHAERMSDPTFFDIEVGCGIRKGKTTDGTLEAIERMTLPHHRRKKGQDWQDAIMEL